MAHPQVIQSMANLMTTAMHCAMQPILYTIDAIMAKAISSFRQRGIQSVSSSVVVKARKCVYAMFLIFFKLKQFLICSKQQKQKQKPNKNANNFLNKYVYETEKK